MSSEAPEPAIWSGCLEVARNLRTCKGADVMYAQIKHLEATIEALTAERDEYRKLWLDSLPVPDYGRPVEENEDE